MTDLLASAPCSETRARPGGGRVKKKIGVSDNDMAPDARCTPTSADFPQLRALSRNRVRHWTVIQHVLRHAERIFRGDESVLSTAATAAWFPEGDVALVCVHTPNLPYVHDVPFRLTIGRNDDDTVILMLSAHVRADEPTARLPGVAPREESDVVVDTLALPSVPSASRDACIDALHAALSRAFHQPAATAPETPDD